MDQQNSGLYPAKFLDISAKPFFPCVLKTIACHRFFTIVEQ